MITVIKKGVSQNGQHWTMLNKQVVSPFGTQILTGFIKTTEECPLAVGATTEIEPSNMTWQA